MHTINISISDLDYQKFGLTEKDLSFSELLDVIEREKMREKLFKSVQIAGKNSLSKMTMEEIDEEIKAVRNNAKLLDIIERELATKNLKEAVELGKKYGFSKTTMEEIDKDINEIRAKRKK